MFVKITTYTFIEVCAGGGGLSDCCPFIPWRYSKITILLC